MPSSTYVPNCKDTSSWHSVSNIKHSDTCHQSVCTSVWKCDNCIKPASFKSSAAKWIRTAVFWDITQLVVVIPYGRFETIYRSVFKGQDFFTLEVGLISCLETMSRNCLCTLRSFQEEPKSNIKNNSFTAQLRLHQQMHHFTFYIFFSIT